jgi:hypothetical protein
MVDVVHVDALDDYATTVKQTLQVALEFAADMLAANPPPVSSGDPGHRP